MPIVDIQRRFRELGRIRTGHKVRTKGGRMAPAKLPRFRLTSPWQHLIEQAAEVYGGEAKPWRNEGTKADEWEVIIDAESLPVVVPPGEVFDQWYELWTGGGCSRRCDGVRQTLVDRACQCPEDPHDRQEKAAKGEACKPTTRLRLMLPDVADVGIWRLESHGFHAAAELGGAAGLVEAATRQGAMIPADLRLAAREGARRPGEPRKSFYVPALSFRGTLGPVLDALGILETGATMPALLGHVQPRPALDAGGTPALPSRGTPFDPAPVEVAGLPGPVPDPDPPPAAPADPAPPAPAAPQGFEPPEDRAAAPEAPTPTPEPFEPPDHDPDEEHGGPTLTGPQIIAMKLKDLGVTDRAEKLRAVALLVGRPVASSKDLTTAEVRNVLDVLNDETEAGEFLAWHRETEATLTDAPDPAPEPTTAPADPEPVVIVPEVVDGPPRATRRPAPVHGAEEPAGWDGDRWRAVLTEHGLKPVAAIREAARLAREQGVDAPANLDAFASSGLADELAGWIYAQGAPS